MLPLGAIEGGLVAIGVVPPAFLPWQRLRAGLPSFVRLPARLGATPQVGSLARVQVSCQMLPGTDPLRGIRREREFSDVVAKGGKDDPRREGDAGRG